MPMPVLLAVPTPATCSALWRGVIIDAPVPGIAVAGVAGPAVDTAAGVVGPTTTAVGVLRLLLFLLETKLQV